MFLDVGSCLLTAFFLPRVHLKYNPIMISSISSVPQFWIFQQAVEQMLLLAFGIT